MASHEENIRGSFIFVVLSFSFLNTIQTQVTKLIKKQFTGNAFSLS